MLELGGIVVLGILAQWLAWRTRVPAILPLIIIGLLVGPLAQLWLGHKLIDPINNGEVGDKGLFHAKVLFDFVALAIGVILFEGGLTLKLSEIKGVRSAITRLITLGSLVTFIGAGFAAYYLMGLSWPISFLFAGLIIVTGPTVIAPILRNVPLNKNVATVLKWEGILIDPIGALVAVLVFEFIAVTYGGGGEHHANFDALAKFCQVVVVGFGLGIGGAYSFGQLLKKEAIPHYLINIFTLAWVLGAFAISDAITHESGLLTVVVMGMALANMNIHKLEEILAFKESITVLLISVLFIVLSANIDITDLQRLGWSSLAVLAVVIFILRPISVFLSTTNSDLTFQEKAFISWVGPRGIVAAGIASLSGLKLLNLQAEGHLDPAVTGVEMLTPLVFLVVLGTVLLNATTARFMAKWLNVALDSSSGIVILGSSGAARLLARYLQKNERNVVLVDSSPAKIQIAKEEGLKAIQKDIRSKDLEENFELLDVGYLFALTASDQINKYACQNFKDSLGKQGAYRLVSRKEKIKKTTPKPCNTLFHTSVDTIHLEEVAEDFNHIHEIAIRDEEHLQALVQKLNNSPKCFPLFIKNKDGNFEAIMANQKDMDLKEDDVLVYMGRALTGEQTAVTKTEAH